MELSSLTARPLSDKDRDPLANPPNIFIALSIVISININIMKTRTSSSSSSSSSPPSLLSSSSSLSPKAQVHHHYQLSAAGSATQFERCSVPPHNSPPPGFYNYAKETRMAGIEEEGTRGLLSAGLTWSLVPSAVLKTRMRVPLSEQVERTCSQRCQRPHIRR